MKKTKRPPSKGIKAEMQSMQASQQLQTIKAPILQETEEPMYDESLNQKARKVLAPKIIGKKGFDYMDEINRPNAFEVLPTNVPAKIVDVKKRTTIVENNEIDFLKLDEVRHLRSLNFVLVYFKV